MIENTTYINLSRQMALEREMAVIANNIANVSTTGYKGEDMVFHEFLVEPKNAKSPISFVLDFGTTRDFALGEARRTDNPLDVMIFGKGFLSVDSGSGVMYTRQGNLAGIQSGSTTTGKGTVDRSEEIDLTLAAIVTQILPNGNLVISGSQEVVVNYDKRVLRITGIVRPEDIDSSNHIQHTQIAEARIVYGGRGVISDLQQPRYGQQIFDVIFPW